MCCYVVRDKDDILNQLEKDRLIKKQYCYNGLFIQEKMKMLFCFIFYIFGRIKYLNICF